VRAGREPERTCVGCRASAPKRELVRIVRAPAGVVDVDRSGSAPGRGAYVHPAASCVEVATRRGGLARALRTGLGREELGRLRNILEGHVEHA
jgi:uncharacterized protein